MGFTILGLILKCVYYRYIHIWAWLIMDYIIVPPSSGGERGGYCGYWKCLLHPNMYFMGELKQRVLMICCIPDFVLKQINFWFGEKFFSTTGTNCSRCSAALGILLIPVILLLAILALLIVLSVIVLFIPVFLTVLLPYIIVLRCIGRKSNEGEAKQELFLRLQSKII